MQLSHNKFQHSFAIVFDISDTLPKRAEFMQASTENHRSSKIKGGKSETSVVHTSFVIHKKKF